MHKKNYKGKCIKANISKCEGVCKSFSDIAFAYAKELSANSEVKEFSVNVPMVENEYMTDFVITKVDETKAVRECIKSSNLELPKICKLLDISRMYWLHRGVTDWGIVIEKE